MYRKKHILRLLNFSLFSVRYFLLKNVGIFLYMFFFLISTFSFSQITFEELNKNMELQAKPVVLYIDSDHCAYCAIQQKQLNKDLNLKEILSSNFYFVALNSEEKSPILFNHQVYEYDTLAEANQLAYLYALESEKIATPTWIIFNTEYTPIFKYNGLLNAKDLEAILTNFTKK